MIDFKDALQVEAVMAKFIFTTQKIIALTIGKEINSLMFIIKVQ